MLGSMLSKKSIRFDGGAFDCELGSVFGREGVGFVLTAGLLPPVVEEVANALLFTSLPCRARYSLRRWLKSGSFKSSSRRRVRSVEACFSLGISSLVADWNVERLPGI